ncbi:MAG: S-layer homology domain-containing protein [Acidaminococcus fermentans]|uniref:S-layer homology domain-containing protein n=1 Tax=Acidaminococcus fermentans TaxID=905 RepID=UPI00242F7F3E|nr:S-layer homology domain-containing protein [Acidaminococcus fermentans]MCI7195264.1 S-layer homology domain-containing protein [Acidaminococcus fermentans]
MKKSLVLAMAMALGVSATAFAANPFSDLPAGHWAYGAVAKLAAAGVVDGYPDGTFKGDRTMTRYEMAQIVAKALAKGAIGADDKLVSEFADELDNLGVRVARLEKNADNVKISGAARYATYHVKGGAAKKKYGGDDYGSTLRSRLWFTGEVNDNWHYTAMLQNVQKFDGQNESGDSDTEFQRAYLEGNIGAVNLTAGRYNAFFSDGNVFDDRADAIEGRVNFGQGYFDAAWGKLANDVNYGWTPKEDQNQSAADTFYAFVLGGKTGNLHGEATYLKANDVKAMGMQDDDKIWTVGADYQAGKLNINAMYLKGDNDYIDSLKDTDDDGYVFGLNYAGAETSKPGSWGLYAKYYDQAAPTVLAHTMNGDYTMFDTYGFKGYMVGGNLTVAKNMVATVEFYDLKGKGGDYKNKHARTLWSELNITF